MKNSKNSLLHWNTRFKKDGGSWETKGGVEQTQFWAELIIEYLPQEIKDKITKDKLSVADIGTALGQIAETFKKVFNDSKITGYDFSDVAIERCNEQYNDINFICGEIKENYDVSILSNIIEHIENPTDELIKHFNYTNKYSIVLCPYKEDPDYLVPEHVVSIDETILIEEINNFKKIYQNVINVRYSKKWAGEMILCVYENQNKDIVKEVIKKAPTTTKKRKTARKRK